MKLLVLAESRYQFTQWARARGLQDPDIVYVADEIMLRGVRPALYYLLHGWDLHPSARQIREALVFLSIKPLQPCVHTTVPGPQCMWCLLEWGDPV